MCPITNFSETSSCFSETGYYVNKIVNGLVDPSVCWIDTSDLFDNLVYPNTV